MRTRAAAVAILSMVLLSGARYLNAVSEQYDASDLANYEATPYGVDLPDWYGETPFFLTWTRGDGQAFVTLAADPLVQGPSRGLGITLYRFGRVGYSALGRALVGWQVDLIPVGLFLANLIGVGILGWIAGIKMTTWGARSLLLPLNPAVYVAMTGDTAEILGIVAIAIAMVSSGRMTTLFVGVLLGSVRPSYLTAAFMARRGVQLATVAFAMAVGLQLFGYSGLGLEWMGSAGNLTVPPMGYIRAWEGQSIEGRAVAVGVAIAALMTLLYAVKQVGARRVAFASTGLLILSLEAVVVGGPRNILRAAGALPLLWVVAPTESTPESDGSGKLENRPL